MSVVDVNTVEHNVLVIRHDTQAGLLSDSVQSSAKGKRVKFDLRESGEEPESQSARAETILYQSSMKSQSRNQNGTGNVTKIPSWTMMRYPEGNSWEQT